MTDISLEAIQKEAQTTNDALLNISVKNDNPLAIGSHTFELTVVDDSGNQSVPAQVILIVRDSQAPTAVIIAADESGRPLTNNALEFGAGFILNGSKSIDIAPGKITKYIWTLLD